MAQQEARRLGYNQVLWLLGDEAQVTEAGASNFFTLMRSKEGKLQLITAPLGDKVILDGVTRRSVIQLVKERLSDSKDLEPVEVVERQYTMSEIVAASEEGRLIECFACGTAVSSLPP
jgi:branched-chain amino acid aminotransferase